MKRFLLVAACLVCALFVAGPASAVVLDSSYLIGTVVDGVPSGAEAELLYVNTLITAYNNNVAAGDIDDAGPPLIDETFTTTTLVTDFGTLESPAVFGTKDDTAPFFDIDLQTTSYLYLYAKYGAAGGDQFGSLYFIGGLTSIEGINPDQGLSHVSLYNPTQVPEGATLMLLGFGLAGVGTFRRFVKR